MSYLALIPQALQAPAQRVQFIVWLQSMPITFEQRMRIYFDWLDLNDSHYVPDEIDSLHTHKET